MPLLSYDRLPHMQTCLAADFTILIISDKFDALEFSFGFSDYNRKEERGNTIHALDQELPDTRALSAYKRHISRVRNHGI